MRLEDLAQRIGVSRYLMSDIEKGKPTAAISGYVAALWVLGISKRLHQVGDPNDDEEGVILENARAPKTAAKRKKKTLDNDF